MLHIGNYEGKIFAHNINRPSSIFLGDDALHYYALLLANELNKFFWALVELQTKTNGGFCPLLIGCRGRSIA